MNKSAKTLMVFAIIFSCVTMLMLFFTTVSVVDAYSKILNPDNLGDAIGGILFYITSILSAIGTVVAGSSVLPFILIVINKYKVKTNFTYAVLIFAIVAMALAICLVVSLPIAANIQNSGNSSSSSLSSSAI